jgi:hypothetical protein
MTKNKAVATRVKLNKSKATKARIGGTWVAAHVELQTSKATKAR